MVIEVWRFPKEVSEKREKREKGSVSSMFRGRELPP
jgi:hypothetical protein